MKAIVCAIAILAFFTTITAKENRIQGRVVINQTPVPIANATVILDSVTPNQQVITTTGGEFEFHVKPGRHRVNVSANNYVPTQNSFLVSKNYTVEIGMNLQTAITAPNQRVVAARVQDSISYYNVEESSLVRLSQSTINPDIMNAIKLLPGVASRGSFDARVYVRGGNSYEVIGILDNIPIYEPYLWGGRVSLFNPNITKNVAFYPGGYHAKGGQSLSGILDVHTKDGNFSKPEGELDVSLLEGNIYYTRPILKEKSTMMLSYRRTYYDLILPLFITSNSGRIEFPYLHSFQTKYTHKISDSQTGKVGIYYFNDGLNIPFDDDGISSDNPNGYFKYDQKFLITSLSHTMAFKKKFVNESNLAFFGRRGRYDFEEYLQNINNYYQQEFDSIILRDDFSWDITESHHFETGLVYYDVDIDDSLFLTSRPDPEIPGSVTANITGKFQVPATLFGAYIQDTWQITDALSMRYGLRYEGTKYHSYDWNRRLDPRIQFKFSLSEDTQFKVYYGTYSQQQYLANTIFDSNALNTSLKYDPANTAMEFSDHIGIGMEHYVSPTLVFKADIFKKNYYDLAIKQESLQETVYLSDGKGYAEGVELILQYLATQRFDGWMTYTYSRTRRHDLDGWFSPEFDLTHMFSVYADYAFGKKSHIIGTYQARSGGLYTPILSANVSNDTGALVYTQGDRLSQRMPYYMQLDVWYEYDNVVFCLPIPFFPSKHKLLKIFPVWFFEGSTRVGISNLLGRKNAVFYSWDDKKNEEVFVNDLPRFFIFGFKLKF